MLNENRGLVYLSDGNGEFPVRQQLSEFTGFTGDGDVGRNLELFHRGAEAELFGGEICQRPKGYQTIQDADLAAAEEVRTACAEYQRRFGL